MLDRPHVKGSPKMVHHAFLRGKRKSNVPPKLISTSDCMWEAASRSLFWARRLQYAGNLGGALAGLPGHVRPHGGRPGRRRAPASAPQRRTDPGLRDLRRLATPRATVAFAWPGTPPPPP